MQSTYLLSKPLKNLKNCHWKWQVFLFTHLYFLFKNEKKNLIYLYMKRISSTFSYSIFKIVIYEKICKIWQISKQNSISGNRYSIYFFQHMNWWYSTIQEWKVTPSSIVRVCAVQKASSPKILERKWNFLVSLSHCLWFSNLPSPQC